MSAIENPAPRVPSLARGLRHPHLHRGFLVEVLVLMAALVVCLAILVQAFGSALEAQRRAELETRAVGLAQTVAEDFLVDPTSVTGDVEEGDLVARVSREAIEDRSGVLHEVVIDVYRAGTTDPDGAGDPAPLYSLHTARYVSVDEARALEGEGVDHG